MGGKHRATGNPRGRPPYLPANLGEQILASLRRQANECGMVKANARALVKEFGVSRATIFRRLKVLRDANKIVDLQVPVPKKSGGGYCYPVYYRIVNPRPVA